MTAVALLPLAVGCFVAGVTLTWPLAHRAGRRSANAAAERDRTEISRILGGLDAVPILDDGQDLPVQHGTIAEHNRRLELVRHAAPVPDIDWHRGEHRLFSWGWVVEVLARFASVGRTFVWQPEEHPLTPPRHAAWNYDTRALEQFVAEASAEEETARQRRIDREYEALTLSMVARRVVLR